MLEAYLEKIYVTNLACSLIETLVPCEGRIFGPIGPDFATIWVALGYLRTASRHQEWSHAVRVIVLQ